MNIRFATSAQRVFCVLLFVTLVLAGCNSIAPGGPGSGTFVASTPSVSNGAPAGIARLNASAFSASLPSGDYKIGPLDVLKVKVFQVKDLDTTVTVATSGFITLPLIGDTRAAGITAAQLEANIARRLGSKYIQSPNVLVTITTYASQHFTVQGAVTTPGIFPMSGPTSLLEGIAVAHGVNQTADTNSVLIFRNINGKRAAAKFDLAAIGTGKANDPPLKAGDIVVVGDSAIREAFSNFSSILSVAGVFKVLFPAL